MTKKLWLDFETFSEVPITHGTHVYAAGAEIMLVAWALDDAPVSVWDVTSGDPIPEALAEALQSACEIWAHNSHFDRTVMSHQAKPMFFWNAAISTQRWRDTMVQALSHGLPGGLGVLCEILKVPTDKAKDKTGKTLIQLVC